MLLEVAICLLLRIFNVEKFFTFKPVSIQIQFFMFKIIETTTFSQWIDGLRDMQAKARIVYRIRNAALGHLGDIKSVGDGVCEMRIHAGAGYRVYFSQQGNEVIFLLCGGDKSSQNRDIERAKRLLKSLENK
jgi:putative addiction module killer protein